MDFSTPVSIPQGSFQLQPCEQMMFVGSCFADTMGQRFLDDKFRAVVNPFGVMYNPVSILHTVERYFSDGEHAHKVPQTVVLSLGTNHVYREKATGEIVDNCQKRPAQLFTEEQLSVEECAEALTATFRLLEQVNPQVRVIFTVSPIRYRKYGFHGSQLSKATLLLAVDAVVQRHHAATEKTSAADYFPAYEIMNDELRDYRFYAPDMLHPSSQAVDYIWQRFSETYFSPALHAFLERWHPLREALAHRPFHPESAAYQSFLHDTQEKLRLLKADYPDMPL